MLNTLRKFLEEDYLQVQKLHGESMSLDEACVEVGMSRRTYDRWLHSGEVNEPLNEPIEITISSSNVEGGVFTRIANSNREILDFMKMASEAAKADKEKESLATYRNKITDLHQDIVKDAFNKAAESAYTLLVSNTHLWDKVLLIANSEDQSDIKEQKMREALDEELDIFYNALDAILDESEDKFRDGYSKTK